MIEKFGFDKFAFIGTVKSGETTGDFPKSLFEEVEGKATLNLEVEADITGTINKQRVKVEGRKKATIDLNVKNGETKNKIEGIKWDDRTEYLDTASRVYKIKVGDIDEKFVTTYDLTKFANEHVEELLGKRLYLTGSLSFFAMNKKIYPIYKVEGIYDAKEDMEDKLELTVNFTVDALSTKISVPLLKKQKAEDRIVGISTLVKTGLMRNGSYENKLAPFMFKMNFTGIDLEDEGMAEVVDTIKELYTLDYSNMLKPSEMKKGKHYKVTATANIINSQSDGGEFDMSSISKQHKFLLERGLIKLEDLKKQQGIRGEYVRDIYLEFPTADGLPTPIKVEPVDILDLDAEIVDEDSVEKQIKKGVEATKVTESEAETEQAVENAVDEKTARMEALKKSLIGKK